ncbi:MAG: helix-turn-helix domain-containing protein [Sphingobium sp.]
MTELTADKAPRQRRTQAERTALSDERMFEAATALIIEKGTSNTTLKEIGERAQYSRGLASYRFGTKENLFRELLARIERSWVNQFRITIEGKRGLAAFRHTLTLFDEFMFSDIAAYRAAMVLRFEAVGANGETAQRIRRIMSVQRSQVERWLREAVEDGDLSPRFDVQQFAVRHISFLYGTMYQLVLDPDAIVQNRLIEDYLSAFMKSCGAGSGR